MAGQNQQQQEDKIMEYRERIDKEVELFRTEAENRVKAYEELRMLGNENPTENQIKSWNSYLSSEKLKPKTLEEARRNLWKKIRILQSSGLESIAAKLSKYLENGSKGERYYEKVCNNLRSIALLYENFMLENIERKTDLIAYFANNDLDFRKNIGKRSFKRIIKEWNESYRDHYNGMQLLYGATTTYYIQRIQNMKIDDGAEVISATVHLGVHNSKFRIFERTTKELHKNARRLARIYKRDPKNSKFNKTEDIIVGSNRGYRF